MQAPLETLQSALAAALGPQAKGQSVDRGQLTVEVAPADLVAACTRLRDDPALAFTTLIDLIGVDYEGHAGWDGPRYAVVYNDTPTSPADPLVCYWDYGSEVTLQDGESFTVDFGDSLFNIA